MDQAWNARVGIAKSLNGSLDEKVLGTLIPPGTLLDAWIVRAGDKIGGAMLAYAFAHQDEVRHMLALPDMMDHNRALLLMEQKATAKPAVPASASRPVSRPPTPIRTAPPIPADQERSDDETLEEFERLEEKRTGGRRR